MFPAPAALKRLNPVFCDTEMFYSRGAAATNCAAFGYGVCHLRSSWRCPCRCIGVQGVPRKSWHWWEPPPAGEGAVGDRRGWVVWEGDRPHSRAGGLAPCGEAEPLVQEGVGGPRAAGGVSGGSCRQGIWQKMCASLSLGLTSIPGRPFYSQTGASEPVWLCAGREEEHSHNYSWAWALKTSDPSLSSVCLRFSVIHAHPV